MPHSGALSGVKFGKLPGQVRVGYSLPSGGVLVFETPLLVRVWEAP